MLTAVTGINWGDEGNGRVIDLLAENADIVVLSSPLIRCRVFPKGLLQKKNDSLFLKAVV